MSAVPVAYDGWSATNGTVDSTTSCTEVGVSCTTLVEEAGFKYEEVVTPNYSYLRMILTDKDATGTPAELGYTSETFIPYAEAGGGFQQGLASKQVIRDAADNFVDSAEIQKGNLRQDPSGTSNAADMWSTRLKQSFSNTDLVSTFGYEDYNEFTTAFAQNPDLPNIIGKKLEITQKTNTGDTSDPSKRQLFGHRQSKGYAGTSTAGFAGPTGNYLVKEAIVSAGSASLNTGADNIVWLEGEDVSTTWIGASSNLIAGEVALSYQRVNNLTTGTSAKEIGMDLPEPLDPFTWNPNFGAQPTF